MHSTAPPETTTEVSTASFDDLALCAPLRRALDEEGYREPTPIQVSAIPKVLNGKDLMAAARTGTGKTAAFALPILQMLSETPPPATRTDLPSSSPTRGDSGSGAIPPEVGAPESSPIRRRSGSGHRRGGRRGRQGRRRVPAARGGGAPIRALVLSPTRELAMQIDERFNAYGRHLPLSSTVVVGGVPAVGQIRALRARPEILVATPGRLMDLYRQGHIGLDRVEKLVLDEADRMLDMGFINDVREIVRQLPVQRQTLFFSATVSRDISRLAADILHDPAYVAVSPPATVSTDIDQRVLFVERRNKLPLLVEMLKTECKGRTLVFTRTKTKTEVVARLLAHNGISAQSIHSDKRQIAREKALAGFHSGKVRVLVATDIVSRGIDVEGIEHVINFELPESPENYVHRIGRTARAGASGIALSFCDFQEVPVLRAIERLTGNELVPVEDHPYQSPTIGSIGRKSSSSRRPGGRRRGPSRPRRR